MMRAMCMAPAQEHKGSVWKAVWAHPEFGQVLATCSLDRTVKIHEERSTYWCGSAVCPRKLLVLQCSLGARRAGSCLLLAPARALIRSLARGSLFLCVWQCVCACTFVFACVCVIATVLDSTCSFYLHSGRHRYKMGKPPCTAWLPLGGAALFLLLGAWAWVLRIGRGLNNVDTCRAEYRC